MLRLRRPFISWPKSWFYIPHLGFSTLPSCAIDWKLKFKVKIADVKIWQSLILSVGEEFLSFRKGHSGKVLDFLGNIYPWQLPKKREQLLPNKRVNDGIENIIANWDAQIESRPFPCSFLLAGPRQRRAVWADSVPFVDTGRLVVIRGNYREPGCSQVKMTYFDQFWPNFGFFTWLQPGSR